MRILGRKNISIMALAAVAAVSCAADNGKEADPPDNEATIVQVADFKADSAYAFIEAQVAFGPRVPGTPGHLQCASYLTDKLAQFGADTVIVQQAKVRAYNGDILPISNIMGRFNLQAKKRLLLVAHWDTRPWADQEPEKENRSSPVPGANDGASGVGVLLEIARNLGQTPSQVGVDILFVDAEDYGNSQAGVDSEESWCLGTQYWTKNPPYRAGELPKYGILLDMVGGKGAVFHREQMSEMISKSLVDKIWGIAAVSGYRESFVDRSGGAVIDDHLFISRCGIPCIDIIETANAQRQGFNPAWHTLSDDMGQISRQPLKAVGQTVLNAVYLEQAN